MRHAFLWSLAIAMFFGTGSLVNAQGAVEDFKQEFDRVLQDTGENLLAKVGALVEKQMNALVSRHQAALAKMKGESDKLSAALKKQGERIAALEKELDNKNKELVALRARLKTATTPKKPVAAMTKAFIGVNHLDPTAKARQDLKLGKDIGAHILELYPGGPADKAGLKKGDVIVAVAGKEVGSKSLETMIRSMAPGKKVAVTVVRGKDKVTREVTLGNRDEYLAKVKKVAEAPKKPAPKKVVEAPKKPTPVKKPTPPKKSVQMGIYVEEQDDKSLLILEVEDGFTGAVAKLQKNDVIISVNGNKVKSLEGLKTALAKVFVGDKLQLVIKRGDGQVTLNVIAGHEKGEARAVTSAPKPPPEKTAPKPPVIPAKKPGKLGLRIAEEGGLLEVVRVTPGSSGAAYGLKEKDRILELDKKSVKTMDELVAGLTGKMAGDTIELVVQRGSDKVVFAGIKLGAAGEKVATPKDYAPKVIKVVPVEPKKEKGFLGLTAQELDNGSVTISEIVEGGPAAAAKLQKDDVIVKVNGVAIKNIDDMIQSLKGTYAGNKVSIVIKRDGKEMNLELTLGKYPG